MKNTNKSTKRAFTLIELLIVIAIIGILFVVLVSKVDFATDKAKASGVQTDFRSFQMAFDTVSKENAGFASLGWDTGDENGNHKRDSYDEGDTNKNNIMESTEIWTGHKEYGETWTGTYTLVNPDDNTDKSAFKLLEDKVNANLDPKLHITITPDKGEDGKLTGNATISMANSARDPWKNEYHGVYITNALNDGGMDRGAFIMYSNGANGQWGSEHDIANGNVSITVPGNNVRGKDDYSMSVFYSYANGYGEVTIVTTGFSNNQKFLGGNVTDNLDQLPNPNPEFPDSPVPTPPEITNTNGGLYKSGTNYTELLYSWDDLVKDGVININGTMYSSNDRNEYGFYYGALYTTSVEDASVGPGEKTDYIMGLLFHEDGSIEGYINGALDGIMPAGSAVYSTGTIDMTELGFGVGVVSADGMGIAFIEMGFGFSCAPTVYTNLDLNSGVNNSSDILQGDLWIPEGFAIAQYGFACCMKLTSVKLPNEMVSIAPGALGMCEQLTSIAIPSSVVRIHTDAFWGCPNLVNVDFDNNANLIAIGQTSFYQCTNLRSIIIPSSVKIMEQRAFGWCESLENVTFLEGTTEVGYAAFEYCTNLTTVTIPLSMKTFSGHAFSNCKNITDVYYAGSESDWDNIFGSSSSSYSSPLRYGAVIYYNN